MHGACSQQHPGRKFAREVRFFPLARWPRSFCFLLFFFQLKRGNRGKWFQAKSVATLSPWARAIRHTREVLDLIVFARCICPPVFLANRWQVVPARAFNGGRTLTHFYTQKYIHITCPIACPFERPCAKTNMSTHLSSHGPWQI